MIHPKLGNIIFVPRNALLTHCSVISVDRLEENIEGLYQRFSSGITTQDQDGERIATLGSICEHKSALRIRQSL